MNLERKFEKKLAEDLRKETADKLKKARNNPTNFKDLKDKFSKGDLPEEYSKLREYVDLYSDTYLEFGVEFEKQKKAILGKIFRTEKYKKRELILNKLLERKKESDIERAKRDYEDKFNQILKESPLTLEERKEYLSTENMEKMNLEDYLTLQKRLSGEAFYHVTRYGVRENTFMSSGSGHEHGKGTFLNNLTPLLKDGRIKSATSTILEEKGKEVAKKFVDKHILEEIKKGKLSMNEALDILMGRYNTDFFLDRDATHFSYGLDRHDMYGGENNYKFYFYYPVEYIMQNNYYHSNREMGLAVGGGGYQPSLDQQYNDAQIFNFGEGVPINAGIFFVTGNIRVDPKTGSQYLLENGKPIQDENGSFKKPEKTISSKEYWEKYFEKNPELKPNKIIYSDHGNDLKSAPYGQNEDLYSWAKEKESFHQSPEKQEEFEEYVKSTRGEIRKIFKEIIQEELNEKSD